MDEAPEPRGDRGVGPRRRPGGRVRVRVRARRLDALAIVLLDDVLGVLWNVGLLPAPESPAFWCLSAPRAHAKTPYKTDLHRENAEGA